MGDAVEFGPGLDVEVLGTLNVAQFVGVFPPPYSRYLYVESDGRGNFTTIAAAIAHAVSKGANSAAANRWTILLSPGIYNESLTLPNGVNLVCLSPAGARINGQLLRKPWTDLYNIYLNAPANAEYVEHLDCTGTGDSGESIASARPRSWNCIYVNQNNAFDGGAEVIRISGGSTATPPIYGLRNCTLYSANRYTGAGTNASIRVIRWMSGANVVIEAFGGIHYKTSSGSTGVVKNPTLALIESELTCYLHSDGTWNCENADDPADPPYLVRSDSLTTHGLLGNVAFMGEEGIVPRIDSAYTGTLHPTRYSHQFENVTASSLNVEESAVFPWSLGYAPSTSVNPTFLQGNRASTVLTVNTMRVTPWEVKGTFPLARMNIRITGGAAGSFVRFLIYKADAYGRPGELFHDAGEVDAGSITNALHTTTKTIPPGWYLVGMGARGGSPSVNMGGGTVPFIAPGSADVTPPIGWVGNYTGGVAPTTFDLTGTVTAAPWITLTTAA